MESGLVSNAIKAHRAVCANFPSIKSYGGVRPGDPGYHGSGQAVDIMVSGATGTSVANFLIANHKALGVTQVIYQQRIWLSSTGAWKGMSDRGSITQNHFDRPRQRQVTTGLLISEPVRGWPRGDLRSGKVARVCKWRNLSRKRILRKFWYICSVSRGGLEPPPARIIGLTSECAHWSAGEAFPAPQQARERGVWPVHPGSGDWKGVRGP